MDGIVGVELLRTEWTAAFDAAEAALRMSGRELSDRTRCEEASRLKDERRTIAVLLRVLARDQRLLAVVIDEQHHHEHEREHDDDACRDAEVHEQRRRRALAVGGDVGESADLLDGMVCEAAGLVPDLVEDELRVVGHRGSRGRHRDTVLFECRTLRSVRRVR
jgi:hypothetical protein